jgi:hypothetical protein
MSSRRIYRIACGMSGFMTRDVTLTTSGVQVQTRRAEFFGHTCITAHRARQQTTRKLSLKIVF